MNAMTRILFGITAASVLVAVVRLAVEHFHLAQTYASAGMGVAIGVGIALGTFSSVPKRTNWN